MSKPAGTPASTAASGAAGRRSHLVTMSAPSDASAAFLDRAGHLNIDDLWHYDHPDDCLTSLGYTIVWSRKTTQSNFMIDYLLHDESGRWYAIRFGGFGSNGRLREWTDKPYRLVLLFTALATPLAGPCPSPGEAAQVLADDEHAAFRAYEADLYPAPFLLAAALDLVDDADERHGHETLIALKHPLVLPSLTYLRHWTAYTDDPAAIERLSNTLTHASQRLWPTLFTPDTTIYLMDVERSIVTDMSQRPETDWPHLAEDILEDHALNRNGSLVFDMLALQWASHPREVDQFSVDIARSLTTPAGVAPRLPRSSSVWST